VSPIAETSPVSFQTTPADSITQRVETVGKVRPHVLAKVVNPAGNVVPVNTPGELVVSGYLLQNGYTLQLAIFLRTDFFCERYWGYRDQTDLVMRQDENGRLWMHTGDQVTLDSDGYLRSAFSILIPLTLDPE